MEDLGIYKNREQCEERVTLLKKQYLLNKKNGSSLTQWTYWEEFRKISEIWQRRVKIKQETETPPPSIINEHIKPEPIQIPEKPPESPSPVQESKRIKLTNCVDDEKVEDKPVIVNGETSDILERLKRIEETNLKFFKRMEERDNQILNVLTNISFSCQQIAESLKK